MHSVVMIWLIVLSIATWIACVIWAYKQIWIENEASNDELGIKIIAIVLIFIPGINHILCTCWLFQNLWDYQNFRQLVTKIILPYYIIKRKIRIKLGYIKVTPNDPYGEEIDD